MTLKTSRSNKLMSQELLAENIKMSRSYIVKLERASATPSVSTMLRLSKGLGMGLAAYLKRTMKM